MSRGIAVKLAAALTGTLLLSGPPAVATAGTPAGATIDARAAQARTALTLAVTGCDDCRIVLVQARMENGRESVWQAPVRKVKDGEVTWKIPTKRTKGLTMQVLADWDGSSYVPSIAMRYAGLKPGKSVTSAAARTKDSASICWAGTKADEVTIDITVERGRTKNVQGERVATPRAYASVTQEWLKPMLPARRGMVGSHDVTYCG